MVVWPGVMMQMEAGEERSLVILPRSVMFPLGQRKGQFYCELLYLIPKD